MATGPNTVNIRGDLAVITGAGDGIGKSIAMKLATEGCNIALVDINASKVKSVENDLKSLFPKQKFASFVCDASDESAIQSLVKSVQSSFNTKTIELLFNNVGISAVTNTVLGGNINTLKKVMDINVWSMIYCTRAFLPLLLKNPSTKQCYIVNTGSIASIETGFSMYSICKHAVIAFSETIREELKRYYHKKNILVSTLVPGFVATNFGNTSSEVLGMEKEWKMVKESPMYKNKNGKMIRLTEISTYKVANLVYELGIKQKKCVIPTHFEWHEAVIKDRMTALLNCEADKKVNMRKAVKKSMAEGLNKSKL